MSVSGYENLSGIQLDVLTEIGNIGASNAATALSSLLNKKVSVGVPKANLLAFKDISNVIGGAENLVVGLLVKLSEDIDGIMMFILDQDSACSLIKMLMQREVSSIFDLTEIDLSALQEIGNILTSSYLTSLAQLTNLKIKPSIPFMSMDMAGAILSVPAIEFGKVGDKALFIESLFGQGDDSVSGYFLLVPEWNSFEKILSTLGVM